MPREKYLKKFEVPYNFDLALVDFYTENACGINFIYLPPFRDDAINSRTVYENAAKGKVMYVPQTREEYEEHLRAIHCSGIPFCVLWQTEELLTARFLDFYVGHGASGFIIYNDDNAGIIKSTDEKLLVISSMTRKLNFNYLKSHDFALYDGIILFFPFSRALNAVRRLGHIREKLTLMPNTVCYTECFASHHWFPHLFLPMVHPSQVRIAEMNRVCVGPDHPDRCSYIFPEDLDLFDPYVGGYKLQGREYTTADIMLNLRDYLARSSSENLLRNPYQDSLKQQIAEQGREKYYNLKSKDLSGED